MSEGKTNKARFSELLDNYPRLAGYWDRSNPNPREWEMNVDCITLERSRLSNRERVVLDCLVSIWWAGLRKGNEQYRIDFTDVATLSYDMRQPLLDWLADPYWL